MNMRYAKRSEDTEQINVVSWAGWNMSRYPELKWLFHVPNGGSRNKQEAVKFKQMGVKAGVSDLCLPYPKGSYCGLFVEMKFGNNRQQDTQKEFLADMAAAGHFVATCYSAEEAIKVIEEYLNLSDAVHMERNLNMSIPNNSIHNTITALYKQSKASMRATQKQLRSLIEYHFREAGGYKKVLCDSFLVAPPLLFGENSPREFQ